ncbi:hypothetical protein PGT21_019516 [Puccinia graminis f. sp. tritici]|uniref:Secreted protein n=1 Tax=Puccinia graminis f. sp. tritici TaxID=56615 RepID=A0A5B0QB44_PUCGR|nr:hypothetical protein PGT21_019516 [Puccinia graminis f. sp. tritici]
MPGFGPHPSAGFPPLLCAARFCIARAALIPSTVKGVCHQEDVLLENFRKPSDRDQKIHQSVHRQQATNFPAVLSINPATQVAY